MSFQEILGGHSSRILKYLRPPEIRARVSPLNRAARDLAAGYLMWKEMMGVVRSSLGTAKEECRPPPEKKSSKFSKRFSLR